MDYFRKRFVNELIDEGDIEVRGLSWDRPDVFKTMDKDAYEEHFQQWVDQQKLDSIERAKDFLKASGCLDRFETLLQRYRTGNVLPFVGAGMSVASGCKTWGPFLLSLLADAAQVRPDVESLLKDSKYEDAAQLIEDQVGADVFAEEIENILGKRDRAAVGTVCLLPQLFKHGCLTTNFDFVLPKAYDDAGVPFKDDYVGERLGEAPRRLGDQPHCLLRLHGQADERGGRVLTTREYNRSYKKRGALTDALQRIAGTRSFLFMGCSLTADRTYDALKAFKRGSNSSPVRHYALLPLPPEGERQARRAFLAEAEIHPIYYPADDHEQSIEDLLIAMLEGGHND
jgi:SIR2-like domain